MLRDLEGNEVQVVKELNGHQFVYGISGYGKTYEIVREIEEYLKVFKKVFVLDYSGSYTCKELCEKNFLYPDRIERFTPSEKAMRWVFQSKNREVNVDDMAEAMYEALHCHSYNQKKLLLESIERAMKEGIVKISDIIAILEEMLEEEKEIKVAGKVENLQRLLTRLYPYAGIRNIEFGDKKTQVHVSKFCKVTILNVSAYPESQRRFLTELFLSLIWREVYRQEKRNRFDVLVLDEIQFLSLKENSTISSMLREGRKRGLELMMGTQYIGHYDKSELRALQQTDTVFIFRPTPEDWRRSAQMIDPNNSRSWVNVLGRLKRGEAVLKGAYRINGSDKIIRTPIIVHIE